MKEEYKVPEVNAKGYQVKELVEEHQYRKTDKIFKELTNVTIYTHSMYIFLYLFSIFEV